MALAVEKLTTANYTASTRTVVATSVWDLPTKVVVVQTGNFAGTTSVEPKAFKVVVGTSTSGATSVQFTAPSTFKFGSGLSANTTYTEVQVTGYSRGQLGKTN